MAEIIVIANQKGGVGKTTTTKNLGYCLKKNENKKVLLIDYDEQKSLSYALGFSDEEINGSFNIGDIMLSQIDKKQKQEDIHKSIRSRYGVDIILGSSNIALYELEYMNNNNTYITILKDALEEIKDEYDYILIDTNPSLKFTTLQALYCADSIIIPNNPSELSTKGFEELLDKIMTISNINTKLKIKGVLLTQVDYKVEKTDKIISAIRKNLKNKIYVFETQIPANAKIASSNNMKMPVQEYNSRSWGAIAYKRLAKEIID